jgi:hypothetical protein
MSRRRKTFFILSEGTAKMRGNIMGKFILQGLQKKEREELSAGTLSTPPLLLTD